jgi:acyl-CoA reductase-like NAD-dependent aldehyde dehydrogenase
MKQKRQAGNLCINHRCRGGLVSIHQFREFNTSSTDSKAGGPDCVLLFKQAKTIGEMAS